ncbi:uncharacterized protein LOC129942284 [Eupeodes corollae]|uniref:uncharacterized protein LOC129942284 n=1 Tax=Eupeodes corollae TaxID=290404 RepID=UPI0024917C2A|nr:uncharacterized protein LOC129942284 [Eupeodes corollae]
MSFGFSRSNLKRLAKQERDIFDRKVNEAIASNSTPALETVDINRDLESDIESEIENSSFNAPQTSSHIFSNQCENNNKLSDKLKHWFTKHNPSRNCTEDLLKILKASGSKQSAIDSIEFSPTKQPRRIFKKTNQQDMMDEMRADIKRLCVTTEQLKNEICTLAAHIKHLIKADVINSKEVSTNFPIETISDLDEIEKRAEEDPQKYTDIFKKIIDSSGGGLEKALKNIISSEIAIELNYEGTNGKHSFKTLTNINSCLYSKFI